MKANLKGHSGIKGLLLLHGEKLAMVGVGLCTALFLYYSMGVPRLSGEFQAEELQRHISQTRAKVDGYDWNTAVAEQPQEIRRTKPVAAKSGDRTVDPEPYLTSRQGWDVPVVRPTVLRPDPELLAAIDVRATGGAAHIPIIDADVMKERQRKAAARDEQKARDEAAKLKKEQEEAQRGGGNFGMDNERGERFGAEFGERAMNYQYDPEHPKRRAIESMVQPPGAPVQGDEKIVETSWAVVVAKVPIREQEKLYRTAFDETRGGYDRMNDFPRYLGFNVQRAEVIPGKALQWANADVYDGQGKKIAGAIGQKSLQDIYDKVVGKVWAGESPEVVAEQYLDFEGMLLFPLPPLLHRDWGQEATHPDIPLAVDAPPVEEELDPTLQEPTKKATDAKNEDELSDFGSSDAMGGGGFTGRGEMLDGPRGFGRGMEGAMRRGPMMGRGMDMEARFERGGGAMRGGGGRRGGGEFEFERGMGGGGSYGGGSRRFGSSSGNNQLPKKVNEWLVRFIDFNVQPGKKYKYRVQLAVDDPNRGLHILDPNKQLEPKVLNRLREVDRKYKKPVDVRFTEWSAPSATVGIPLSGSVRLASVKPQAENLYNVEPAATLLIESFDIDEEGNSIFSGIEQELSRGFVANLVEDSEYLVSDGRSIDTIDDFKFMTGATVVDIRGGEKLAMAKDMQAPSRVLLMDAAGELVIRSELTDADAIKLHRAVFAKPDKRRATEGGEFEGERMMRGGALRGEL